MVKSIRILLALLVLLQACSEEEELITGTITGRIGIYDQTRISVPDRSGVEVSLLREGVILASDITEGNGIYLFENVPYGKYRIRLKKDKYVQGWNPPFFNHVGGYSPTYAGLNIYEVPVYVLSLDSIGYYQPDNALIVYLKVDGDSVITGYSNSYPVIAYAGSSPDVSKDNYATMGKGFLRDYWIFYNSPKVAVYGKLSLYDIWPPINDVIDGPVFLRIYPLANGQGYGNTQFYPDALGKPSNVISFDWNDLIGK